MGAAEGFHAPVVRCKCRCNALRRCIGSTGCNTTTLQHSKTCCNTRTCRKLRQGHSLKRSTARHSGEAAPAGRPCLPGASTHPKRCPAHRTPPHGPDHMVHCCVARALPRGALRCDVVRLLAQPKGFAHARYGSAAQHVAAQRSLGALAVAQSVKVHPADGLRTCRWHACSDREALPSHARARRHARARSRRERPRALPSPPN